MPFSSSRKYSLAVCSVRAVPKSIATESLAFGEPSQVHRFGGSRCYQ